jgi:heme exporter protein C
MNGLCLAPEARRRWWHDQAPARCYALAGRLLPWCWGTAALCAVAGLALGLLVARSGVVPGEAWRITFVHLPAAWMSMGLYLALALAAGTGLVAEVPLAAMLAGALAPTGALMAFLALWTGSLWVRPTAGLWWVWDLRLTAELLLLALYVGFLALQAALPDERRADRACAVLALLGLVNLGLLYVSVRAWHALHQGAVAGAARLPPLAGPLLAGLLLMAAAFGAWCAAVSLHRLRSIILEREHDAAWAQGLPEGA